MLERDERGIALQEYLALAARAAALLSPFAEQRPAAEQILLQDDLVVARRFGARGAGLHEQSHRPPILRRSGFSCDFFAADAVLWRREHGANRGFVDIGHDLGYVMDAVRLIRRELNERVPLIGFAGSPWTLACYMIEGEGSASFARAKALAWDDPKLMHTLLETLARSVAAYLAGQAAAGAQALMVFDTWGGLLGPAQFREFSLRWLGEIVARLKADPVARDLPIILFSKGANAHLEALADTGCAALGVDWTISIGQARKRVGDRVALQGNLDPVALAASPDAIKREVRAVLDDFGADAGHVFNLGHGITPDIKPEHVALLVDTVHALSTRSG